MTAEKQRIEGRPYCTECEEEIKGPWESHLALRMMLGEVTQETFGNNILALLASGFSGDTHIRCTDKGKVIGAYQELQNKFAERSGEYRNDPGPIANRLK